MTGLNTCLVATCLTAAMLTAGEAQAMTIWQFDKMADADRDEYVAALVIGARRVLREDGRSELARQMELFFTEIEPGQQIPLGMSEFQANLAKARATDLENVQHDPGALRIEVEDALALTVRNHGLELPESFFTVASGFTPKNPPQKH